MSFGNLFAISWKTRLGLEGMGLDVGPGDDAQSMDNLDQFLEDRARALEA